jgi:hypothetical protein
MEYRVEAGGTEAGMRTCSAIVEYIGLLPRIDVELVGAASWILVAGESESDVAVVAKRLLRLSAAAQPNRRLSGDGNTEVVDHRNGTIEQIRAVAADDDPRGSRSGLAFPLDRTFVCHVLECSLLFSEHLKTCLDASAAALNEPDGKWKWSADHAKDQKEIWLSR